MKAQLCPMCNGQKYNIPKNKEEMNAISTLECGVCHGKGIIYLPENAEEFTLIMNYIPTATVYSETDFMDCETSSTTCQTLPDEQITLT